MHQGQGQGVLNSPRPTVSQWDPPTLSRNDGVSRSPSVCVGMEGSNGRGKREDITKKTAGCPNFAPSVRQNANERSTQRGVPPPASGGHTGSSAYPGQNP